MFDSNDLEEDKEGGDACKSNDTAVGILASFQADINQQTPESTPLRSRSPFVDNENRKTCILDHIVSTKGPRCSHDLHTGPTIEYKSGLDTFVFPTPSPRLPTPSPRHSPRPPPRSATPQPMPSDRRRVSPRIGMAIGSPSQAPPSWGRSQTADCISSRIQQRPPPNGLPAHSDQHVKCKTLKNEQRTKKTSSWRMFSNLFKKSTKPVRVTKAPLPKNQHLESPLEQPVSSRFVKFDTVTATLPLSATLPAVGPFSRQRHSRTLSDSQAQPRCESRNSIRTSFTRLLRSPCARTTPSSSPWQGNFFHGEQLRSGTLTLHPYSATVSRTPRLELDLPEPELERYSVMFSHLLAPASSDGSKPSLLERRLSRMPVENKVAPTIGTLDAQSRTSTDRRQSRSSTQLKRSLSVKVDPRRNTSAAPVMTTHRPRPVMRSQTAPMYETSQQLASSPESNAESASHSETSLPATPTTPNACIGTAGISIKQERETAWNERTSQPMVVYPSDVMSSRVDHAVDLEQQIVQVSVARQVSINQARSRVHRTVSTSRPNMVNHVTAKNRKSEVGILDSVDSVEEEMP